MHMQIFYEHEHHWLQNTKRDLLHHFYRGRPTLYSVHVYKYFAERKKKFCI